MYVLRNRTCGHIPAMGQNQELLMNLAIMLASVDQEEYPIERQPDWMVVYLDAETSSRLLEIAMETCDHCSLTPSAQLPEGVADLAARRHSTPGLRTV